MVVYPYSNMLTIQSSSWSMTWKRLKHEVVTFCFWANIWFENNFNKRKNFCFGEAKEYRTQYIVLFGCNPGTFPMRYLGIPIHYRKLTNADWSKVEERFEKRLSSWKGKNLLIGERLTSINLVLSSLPMYSMSFFEVPKGVLRFFWQCNKHKRKYRLAKWDILCQPKEDGGVGII